MTERPQGDPGAYDDPTRDITLPPLPDRPPPALPRAWVNLPPSPPSDAAPDFSAPPPEVPTAAVAGPTEVPAASAPVRGPHDGPTDQLPRPDDPPRERTLAFSAPEMSQRPARPVQVARTPRRWPWVVLVLLVVAIIVGTGIALLVLLRAG